MLKGLGDILFPEIPGLMLGHAILYESIAVLVDILLFFEAYRLLKAATAPKTKSPVLPRLSLLVKHWHFTSHAQTGLRVTGDAPVRSGFFCCSLFKRTFV